MENNKDNPGVIAFPPLLLLIALVLGLGLSAFAPLGVLEGLNVGARYAIGGVLIAIGAVNAMSAVTGFGAAKTPVNPNYTPTALVTTGVFGVLRNPMYVTFYLVCVGIAFIFAADWLIATAIILSIVIHYGVIKREELYLENKFSAAYTDYCAKVKRYALF